MKGFDNQKMKIYFGLLRYDEFDCLRVDASMADGFIIGDILCNNKMFHYGEDGLAMTAMMIANHNKEVVYQTPLYITDRNFSIIKDRVLFLKDCCGLRKVLVQDVGMAIYLRNNNPEIELIWSRFGRTRQSVINRRFLDFIKELDIRIVESDIPTRIEALESAGIEVSAVYGNTKYNTISRECYNSYMIGKHNGMCRRECILSDMKLETYDFQMSMDGCVLGEQLTYNEDECFFQIVNKKVQTMNIYAKNYEEANERFERLKEKGLNL